MALRYTSEDFREILRISKMAQSMGKVGTSYDSEMSNPYGLIRKKSLYTKLDLKPERRQRQKYLTSFTGTTTNVYIQVLTICHLLHLKH
jgi:transposase InsO family protein